jgi:hypothetical protein
MGFGGKKTNKKLSYILFYLILYNFKVSLEDYFWKETLPGIYYFFM